MPLLSLSGKYEHGIVVRANDRVDDLKINVVKWV
jgi:hypothetical protein